MTRILVLGGTGMFGGALCRLLAGHEGLEVRVAARRADRAAALIERLKPAAAMRPVALDAARLAEHLAADPADWVADCVGPYQTRGAATAMEAVAAGADYCDLSDSHAYCQGLLRLDGAARAAGRAIITGASTLPALSAAVLDALTGDMEAVEKVFIGLSPGGRIPIGIGLVRTIFVTAGRPLPGWRGGRAASDFGYGDPQWREIPGVGMRGMAAIDAPDRLHWPGRLPGLRDLQVTAGIEFDPLQRVLAGLARLVHGGLLPGVGWLARPGWMIGRAVGALAGSDTGGMVMEVSGQAGGRAVRRRWWLVAGSGHGPLVPAIPCALLALGPRPEPGARLAAGAFTLADYERLIGPYDIRMGRDGDG